MKIIPAIDIRNGKCVRLFQGDYNQETIYDSNPIVVAQKWESQGAQTLHLVDLDGAKEGRLININSIKEIINVISIPIQVGGGIRSITSIIELIKIGVSKIILGTVAIEDKYLLNKAIDLYGDKIVVSLDSKDGALMKQGWLKKTNKKLLSTVQQLKNSGVRSIIFTDISKDGTMTEPNYKVIQTLISKTNMDLIVAGGVSSIEQIIKLKEMNIDSVIIGKALYEGKINLKEIINYAN
ncbi:MAG: 1-(5-phosphoribosyl)-5-[(5-phosphoribosylamino)methylideneamino]imidazole-4-carboxamide isomerase [Candidatus Roizmanbacteria bacterium]|nr:1-(5-phosphoribosyl)-5-[(5-phosphoribosylamino)methylideneamino]imidazole-4-carboxamide isomerase [Candidatus Roizmanbacteria bacterium]